MTACKTQVHGSTSHFLIRFDVFIVPQKRKDMSAELARADDSSTNNKGRQPLLNLPFSRRGAGEDQHSTKRHKAEQNQSPIPVWSPKHDTRFKHYNPHPTRLAWWRRPPSLWRPLTEPQPPTTSGERKSHPRPEQPNRCRPTSMSTAP